MQSTTSTFQSPWRFWHGAAVLASAMTLYILLSRAHMEIVRQTVGMQAYLGEGPRLPPHVLVAGQVIKAGALLTMLWLVGLRLKGLSARWIGLVPVKPVWIGLGVLTGLGGFCLLLALAKLIVVIVPDWLAFAQAPFALDAGNSLAGSIAFLAMTLAITPVAEEIFFRGFLFRWMSGHHRVWLAAGVSSVMFGVAHILPPQAIAATLMGLVLCWLYWRTGSIWPSVAAHVTNNAIGIGLGAAAAGGHLPAWLTP